MADEFERAVYVQRIDPERTDEYVRAHDDVPDGVTDAMEHGGVERFPLFVRDDIAVCILDVTDLDEYNDVMTSDETVHEWERYVAQFKTEGVDVDAEPDEQIPYMEEIWLFEP